MHKEKMLNDLYQQAIALKKLKPWSFMLEDQVFGVIHPITQQMVYCSITGHIGEEMALTVYLDDASFRHIYKVMCDSRQMPSTILTDHILSVRALKCSFESKVALFPEEEDRLKMLGLRFRGENAWPACRSLEPGKLPHMLIHEEACLFLTQVLVQTIFLVKQVKKQKVYIEPIQRADQIPCLVPGKTGEFYLTYKDIKLNPERNEVSYSYTNELELKKILGLKTESLMLECATVLLPIPIGEDGRGSLPTLMIAVNPRDGQIFFVDAISEEISKSFEERGPLLLSRFIQSMLINRIKPKYITVNKEEDYLLLQDFCNKARIDLKMQPFSYYFCEALEEMTHSLMFSELLTHIDEEGEDYILGDLHEDMEDIFSKEIKHFIEMTTQHMMRSRIVQAYSKAEKESLEVTIDMFVRLAYDLYEAMPTEWTRRTVELVFKEAIPACVTIAYAELKKIPRQLRDYFTFLGEEKFIYNTEELIRAIKINEASLLKNAGDASKWNPVKMAAMRALEAGMEAYDPHTILNHMKHKIGQAEIQEARHNWDKRNKIGRNEPCPCGSGKK